MAGPRIGIVGFGRMAEIAHLEGLRRAGFAVETVMDITPARREAAARAGIPLQCERMEQLLELGLDAALIAPHSGVRAEVAVPLSRAGLHLLIEKPLATTAAEARLICEECERAGVLASVFHNRRWDPDVVLVRQAIDEGLLGEVIHMENRSFHDGPAVEFGAAEFHQPWRIEASMGGGTLLDFGPHWLDQILSCTATGDRVVSVFADVRHLIHGDADDHFSISMSFESGLHAIAGKTDICPLGPNCKWFVIGIEACAIWRNDALEVTRRDGNRHILDQPAAGPDLYRNFRDAIEGKADLLVTVRQSLRACEIIDAARESSRTRRSVDVSM